MLQGYPDLNVTIPLGKREMKFLAISVRGQK